VVYLVVLHVVVYLVARIHYSLTFSPLFTTLSPTSRRRAAAIGMSVEQSSSTSF
jgi:hypothetical protein